MFEISGREISINQPPYIIAELSANHNGSIERAKESIKVAKENGVDAKGAKTTDEVLQKGASGPLAEAYWPAILAVIDPTIDAKTPEED